jgi:hypothetical protein
VDNGTAACRALVPKADSPVPARFSRPTALRPFPDVQANFAFTVVEAAFRASWQQTLKAVTLEVVFAPVSELGSQAERACSTRVAKIASVLHGIGS